jgi:hypothetical protein
LHNVKYYNLIEFVAKNSLSLNKMVVKYYTMASFNDTKKNYLNNKNYSISQTNNQYTLIENFQSPLLLLPLLLPTSPTLQFQRPQNKYENRKDSAEQKIENKDSLDNTKENIGKYMKNSTIMQYPSLNADKLIDNYRQTTESIRENSLDYLKLQKDIINAFQPPWVQHIENSVDNYLVFQNKIIMLYAQMCNGYYKNIINIKTKSE